MRLYALELDEGPKPWETGLSREFRFATIAKHEASRRDRAVKYFRHEYEDEIRDAAAWRVVLV